MKKNTRLSSGRICFSAFFPKRTYEMDNQTLIWNVKIYDGTGGQPIAGCPLPFPATLCLPVPHYSKMARDNCNGCSQRLSISIPLSEKTLPWKSGAISVGTLSSCAAVPLFRNRLYGLGKLTSPPPSLS